MGFRRRYVSVAVVGEVIYEMAGCDDFGRLNTAERYDYKTNEWSLIAPMNMPRSEASATALNGKVYIVGGTDDWGCLNSAEVYDPESNQWTAIRDVYWT
jgi:kelch-like protein 10